MISLVAVLCTEDASVIFAVVRGNSVFVIEVDNLGVVAIVAAMDVTSVVSDTIVETDSVTCVPLEDAIFVVDSSVLFVMGGVLEIGSED